MAKAIAWFGCNGYTVCSPLNDTQWYDLVVEKDNIFYTVQCKATNTQDKRIDFRSTGGTNGGVYANVLDSPLDYIFCIDAENMWLIPMEDIRKAGNSKSISLRTEPNSNNQGFQTYKYLVTL